MGIGKGSSSPETGVMAHSVPPDLVHPHSHQKDGKEKPRIRKRPRRQPPLSGTQELRNSLRNPPIVDAPALLAPHPAPSLDLRLPGFFPGSGILREITPGSEQSQATQGGSEQDPSPTLYKGPSPSPGFLICLLPNHLLNIDKFQRARLSRAMAGPHCSRLSPVPFPSGPI